MHTELYIKHKDLKKYQGHLKDHQCFGKADYKEDAGVDEIVIYLNFDDKKIKNAMFTAKGKEEVFVAASAMCEMIIGKHYGDAQKITPTDLGEKLGLTKNKMFAAELAIRAFYNAIADKQKRETGDPFDNIAEMLGGYVEGYKVGDPKFEHEHCGCGAGLED